VSWIPLFAALGVLVIAAVVLGYCAHEIAWRSRRLQRDVQQLRELGDGFATLQGRLAAAQQRLQRPGAG
jgi:hypothetical protein